MTPVFCCGFECGVNNSHWSSQAGTNSYSTTTIRSGARSLRINPTAAASYVQISQTNNLSSANKWVVRLYLRFTTLPNATVELCTSNSSSRVGAYFKSSDSKIYAGTSTGNLGASGVTVTTGTWYLLDVLMNTSGATWSADVQVDGAVCTQATLGGQVASSSAAINLGSPTSSTQDTFYDDVLCSHTDTDYPLGAGFVNHFIPTSDGTHNVAGANDFEFSATGTDITNATTTAFTLIDDVPLKTGSVTEYINLIAPPNATDYVEVVFGPASGISVPTVAPRSVTPVIAKAKGTGTGANNLRIVLNDNGTTNDIFNGDTTDASPTASYVSKHYATPPTGGSWTVSAGAGNFNNLRMRCLTSDAAPDPWWASAMIEAEFAPLAAPAFISRMMLMGVG